MSDTNKIPNTLKEQAEEYADHESNVHYTASAQVLEEAFLAGTEAAMEELAELRRDHAKDKQEMARVHQIEIRKVRTEALEQFKTENDRLRAALENAAKVMEAISDQRTKNLHLILPGAIRIAREALNMGTSPMTEALC